MSATATDHGNTSDFSDFNLIQVAPVAELFTSEGGAQAKFSVVIAIQPTSNVTNSVDSSETTEGTAGRPRLPSRRKLETSAVATITGVNDSVADGPIGYTIITGRR